MERKVEEIKLETKRQIITKLFKGEGLWIKCQEHNKMT